MLACGNSILIYNLTNFKLGLHTAPTLKSLDTQQQPPQCRQVTHPTTTALALSPMPPTAPWPSMQHTTTTKTTEVGIARLRFRLLLLQVAADKYVTNCLSRALAARIYNNTTRSITLAVDVDPDEAGALLGFHFTYPSAGSGRV